MLGQMETKSLLHIKYIQSTSPVEIKEPEIQN